MNQHFELGPKVFGPKAVHIFALVDALMVLASLLTALVLRFEFNVQSYDFRGLVIFALGGAFIQLIAGYWAGLYTRRFPSGSIDEIWHLTTVSVVTFATLAVAAFFVGSLSEIPRSVPIIAFPFFLGFASGLRFMRRLLLRNIAFRRDDQDFVSCIVFGAGTLSEQLIPQLLQDQDSKYRPVCMVDDDPAKARRTISGIKVEGVLEDVPRLARIHRAGALIVAVPRADAALLAKAQAEARLMNMKVVVLPSFSQILENSSASLDLRELDIEELVGRRAIQVNKYAVDSYINGRTVLITGAGGSIGSELCRQVSAHGPSRLVFLDRDETGLQNAELGVTRSGLLDSPDTFLADIRDRELVSSIFKEVKPDVVFHAAALKHLPALERFPDEAWKTNVLGTANVLAAASESSVSHLINISTDKAADPSSVLGRSKKIAEGLTSWYSQEEDSPYHSVRFGNVVGSRGSLVPTLQTLIGAGGPVVLTDPRATRYFMTVREACGLVLQAGTQRARSSIFVFDMGEPVSILSIAEKMIEMSGRDIEIVFSGLRRGEKLHERVFSELETLELTDHNFIWKTDAPAINPAELPGLYQSFA